MASPSETSAEKSRRSRLKRLFNITPEEYERVLEFQHGGCAICRRPPGKTRLAVDHNHTTGLVRGLVCWQCNAGLAKFRDSAILTQHATEYLLRPPVTTVLGEERIGRIGRVTTKTKRKRRRKSG